MVMVMMMMLKSYDDFIDDDDDDDDGADNIDDADNQRESFWLKLLRMTGAGRICVILTISDHFAFLVGSKKCLENVILIFFGS